MSSSECIKVMIRVRPLNDKEKANKNFNIVKVSDNKSEITISSPNQQDVSKSFNFDAIFTDNDKQSEIYEQSAFSLVEQVVEGYNGTIFAYGQTGCGKTHSMVGSPSEEGKGLIPRSFQHVMNLINAAKDKKFLIRCSYIEIYNEEIRDLLSSDVKCKRDMKESPDKGVFIKDLNMMVCKNIQEMDNYMAIGNKSRSTGATLMNADSSRSHSIFTCYIECSQHQGDQEQITAGKLNLVDLAGSERQSKTGATGDRLKEANKINLSLSALGNVISALVDGKSSHIPYRDSKLTRLLQDSLGGNTKTIMIAAVSPANYNYDETLGTLRYASRAKNIVNKPKINQDPKDALLKEYFNEIERLKKMLSQKGQQQKTFYGQEQKGDFEDIQNELKKRDERYIKEKNEKEKIQQILAQMEGNMVEGKNDDKSNKKYEAIRKKLDNQAKKHEDLLKEKELQEDQLQELRENCTDVKDEAKKLRSMINKYKRKIKNNDQEIKDIQREDEIRREDLLEQIRQNEKDAKFFQKMVQVVFSQEEVQKLQKYSHWNPETQTYAIPKFEFTAQTLKLPKLNSKPMNLEVATQQSQNYQSHKRNDSHHPFQQQKHFFGEDPRNDRVKDRYQIYNHNFTVNINNNVQNNINLERLNTYSSSSQQCKRKHRLSPLKNITKNIANIIESKDEKEVPKHKLNALKQQQQMEINFNVQFDQGFHNQYAQNHF